MLSEELVDIATRHQVYLERLKAGELQRTDPLFVALAASLMEILGRLGTSNLADLTYPESASLVAAISKGQVELYGTELKRLSDMLFGLSEESHDFEIESINEVLNDKVQAHDTEDDKAGTLLWARVQERPMSATGKLLSAWLGAWVTNEVTRSEDMVRKGVADGWSVSDLIIAFRGTKAKRYIDGLLGSAKRNTATTINTAIQHVSSVARSETMARVVILPKGIVPAGAPPVAKGSGDPPPVEVKIKEGKISSIPRASAAAAGGTGIMVGSDVALMGYRWISILDNHTSLICQGLDYKVFLFGQGPLPPAHPNCRSSIIAEVPGKWLRRGPLGRFIKKDERKAAGADGTEAVDGKVSYYEWLKTQPEAFQNDALGVTRATLFRNGGMSAANFASLNLSRTFQPLTLDEMRQLKPNAFRRAGI